VHHLFELWHDGIMWIGWVPGGGEGGGYGMWMWGVGLNGNIKMQFKLLCSLVLLNEFYFGFALLLSAIEIPSRELNLSAIKIAHF
jgi:hypothetical protein